MELVSCCEEDCDADGANVLECEKEHCEVQGVKQLKAMRALSTDEADFMGSVKCRMTQADRATLMDMPFYKNSGISEKRKHTRYPLVVQSCLLHSGASWSWTKEMIDTICERASSNLEVIGVRNWSRPQDPIAQDYTTTIGGVKESISTPGPRGVCLELRRAKSNSTSQKKGFAKNGGDETEVLLLARSM